MRKERSNIKYPAFAKASAGRQIAKVFFIILLLLFVFLLKNKNNNSSGLVYADACMSECNSGETSNQGCAVYNCPAGTSRNCECIANSDACCSAYPNLCDKGHWSCTCDPDSSCASPTNTPAPNNPTRTPTPKPPTATPVPVRPALCKSATISKTTLGPGESLTITSTANTNKIKTFTYAFYNLDNFYPTPPANNPKGIFFVANTHYVRSDSTTPPVTTHAITVTYNELNKPDRNWNSKKPIKIQVNAYFTNSQGGSSLPDAKCVVKFNMTLTLPTKTPTPKPPTATPDPTAKSCSVSVSGDSVTLSGSNAPAGNNVRLWLARQDKDAINPAPPNKSIYIEGAPLNYTAYNVDDCNINAQGTCSKTYTVWNSLPAGDYYFHCDIKNDPGKCSGQPFCDYEHPPMPGGKNCTVLGYRSCSNNDNITYTKTNSPTATPTPVPPTATPIPGCLCNTDGNCAAVCAFEKFVAPITYVDLIKCSLSDDLFPTVPSTDNKNSWCQATKRTKGDADGSGSINTTDYFYYVAAVSGGKISVTVNPDFDGDGVVSNVDREIIIKSLSP